MHPMKQRPRRPGRDQCSPENGGEFILADEGLDWLDNVADQLGPKERIGLLLLITELRHWRSLAAEAEEE